MFHRFSVGGGGEVGGVVEVGVGGVGGDVDGIDVCQRSII